MSSNNPKFDKWLNELRTEATRKTYNYASRYVLGENPDVFLSESLEEREATLTSFIQRFIKEGKSGLFAEKCLQAVRSFCTEYNILDINWKKIFRKLPERKREANDRIPTLQEIRALLDTLPSFRDKGIPLTLKSSGARIGAIPNLKLCDYQKISIDGQIIARLIIHRGSTEEYYSFVDSETVKILDAMLEERRLLGENLPELESISPEEVEAKEKAHKLTEKEITESPPLFRTNQYAREDVKEYLRQKQSKPINEESKPISLQQAQKILERGWIQAGIRTQEKGERGKRKEFQRCHSLRKWFSTKAREGIKKELDMLKLENHRTMETKYYRPTLEYMAREYLKAIPYLAIGEVEEVKKQAEEQKKIHTAETKELRERLENVEKQMSEMLEYFREKGIDSLQRQIEGRAS